MAQLDPVPTPLVVFPDFIAQQQETVVLKGRQFGAIYDVTTIDGGALLAVYPGMAGLSRRKKVLDAEGRYIFNVRRERRLGSSRYVVASPSLSNDITVEFNMFATGMHFIASYTNTISQLQGQLYFDRGYWSSHGKITDGLGGPVVADAERKISMLKKEYHVTVAPGMDMALIAGIMICLDEKEKSHGNAPGLGGGKI